jgi:hypothetical protein
MLQFAGGANAQQGSVLSRAAEPVQVAQMPPGGPGGAGGMGGFPQMTEAERAKMREQMMDRMLDGAGLTAKEKAAARQTVKAKDAARSDLMDRLVQLQRAANKTKPSGAELRQALAAYRAAMARHRAKIQSLDQALTKHLSLRSQVRCVSMGILDNGLPGMGMGRPGGMGGGRRGQ